MDPIFDLSPALRSRLAKSLELGRWIDANKPASMETRSFSETLSAAYFSLALEHHLGVGVLFRETLPSCAFALMRSVFEAYWRGEWAHKVASTDDLERFRTGVFEPKPDATVQRLRKTHPEIGNLLERFKRNNWEALSGFAHGGFSQMVQQVTHGYVGPNFSDEVCAAALRTTDYFAIISAVSLGEIARVNTRPFEEMARTMLATWEHPFASEGK
jgi:hypothetical protein